MPVSSEIFSVDTLQILPAEQAFKAGRLLMPTSPSDIAAVSECWSDFPLNRIMLMLCTVAAIIFLNRYIGLLPYLFGGVLRWKEIVNLESSVRLTRDRNNVAVIAFFIVALAVSRFEIYSPDFLSRLPASYRTLGVVGLLAAFLLLRKLMSVLLSVHARAAEQTRIANMAFYNFLIVIASVTVLVFVSVLVFNFSPIVVRGILLTVIAFVYMIFIIRKMQILTKVYGLVKSILYLCSLELLPAAVLVASNYMM